MSEMEVQPLRHSSTVAPAETLPPSSPSPSPSRPPSGSLPSKSRRRRRNEKICLACGGITVGVVILLVILCLTVFKVKKPKLTIESVTLENLHFAPDFAKLRVEINVTLDVSVLLKNPNIIGMKYADSSAYLKYRGQVVGQVPIPAGKIGGDDTRTLNVALTLLADRLIGNGTLFTDVVSEGILPLVTDTTISGKVAILKIFKFHVKSYSSCSVDINVRNFTVGEQKCRSKIKL